MIARIPAHPWGYVIGVWVITAVVLGVYATAVIRKGRALAKRVPEDKRRWM